MTSTVCWRMSGAMLLATVMLAACGDSSSLRLASVDGTVATSTSVAPTSSATTTTPSPTSIAPDDALPPGETWTRLTPHDVGAALQPSRVLLELTQGSVAAISLDGLIVVSKPAAKGHGLYAIDSSGPPVDTGIRVATGSTIRFGPHGDLFVQEPNADYSAMNFSEYRPSATGAWQKVESEAGPITGPCKFMVTPERVGCPDTTGPAIVLDPPVPFDRVTEVQPLVGASERVVRTGGPIERSWNVRADVPLGTSCDSDECHSLYVVGPGSSAIWYPLLAEPTSAGNLQAIFLFDDSSTARAAVLEGDRVDVVGVLGNELVCVQTAGGATRLVAYDLS